MKKIALLIAISSFLIFSCAKDKMIGGDLSDDAQSANSNTKPHSNFSTKAAGKNASGCIVDRKAGVQCTSSAGNSCKKLQDCTALESLDNAQQHLTTEEYLNWPNVESWQENQNFLYHMWQQDDWFEHPDSVVFGG